MNPEVLLPEWPTPTNVHARCSTRLGGRSSAPYDSLNLGIHVGDRAEAVAANRSIFAASLGVRPVFLNQVHGRRIVELVDSTPDGAEADGCVTGQRALACTIMVADCLPVLLCDAGGAAVAAAHAGWRGLAGQDGAGVLEQALESFWRVARISHDQVAARTIAWLGPCIGPAAFEVGAEVKSAFDARHSQASDFFVAQAPGKWLADLQGLASLRLRAAGVTQIHGNDGGPEWCTVSNPSRFFSHRRDGVGGRFAASIWLS